MTAFRRIRVGSLAIAALVAAGYASTVGAAPSRTGAQLTVAPPTYFTGTPRPDALRGTNGNDVLIGLAGGDQLDGRGGNDVLRGGDGDDRLTGGLGRDILFGGRGNDRFYTRDGERDVIDGGPGFDRAWVDRFDVVRNVERVYRR